MAQPAKFSFTCSAFIRFCKNVSRIKVKILTNTIYNRRLGSLLGKLTSLTFFIVVIIERLTHFVTNNIPDLGALIRHKGVVLCMKGDNSNKQGWVSVLLLWV